MIFATVGTTLPFDELLEELDRLAGQDFFDEPLLVQTGTSRYEPKNYEHFRFRPSIEAEYERASLLIVHGGTGSTLHALHTNKPFIAFANPRAQHDHQAEFLEEMSQVLPILWSRDVADLERLYRMAQDGDRGPLPVAQRERFKAALLEIIGV